MTLRRLIRRRRTRRFQQGLVAAATGLGLAATAQAGSITGVCPDGSMYVVRHESQIPCPDSKRVQPGELPPIRPENLPRPYTWQVYNEGNNPNNAYNLVDQARQVRALRDGKSAPAPPAVSSGPPSRHPSRSTHEAGPVDLGLTDGEMHDLFLLVELSQDAAPVEFTKQTADGRELLRVALAHSEAFEGRFREAWRGRGTLGSSRVLLFTAVARQADAFYGNFTLTQGHLAFQPSTDDASQFGILQGRLGELEEDEVVLGYLVLPDTMNLQAPVDVYWNDRHTSVTFQP